MLEKAKIPGEKNMTGGVLYGDFPDEYGFISLVPDFESSAPLERHVLSHEVVLLGPTDYQKGESRYFKLSKTSLAARLGLFNLSFGTGHDYTVLRRNFDRWFANRAVQAGAMLSTETTVEGLIKEGDSVVGVRTTKEELRARLVIDSSGVTSRLVEEAGLRGRLSPKQLYHGIKRVYKLDAGTIEKRFKVAPGEGRSIFFLGEFMEGVGGGAFVYTNRDTLSVGLVVSMESLLRATTEHFDRVGKLIDVQDEFEAQPMVAELLDGAEPLEYAAHNIPKGFKSILQTPCTGGFLVAGDALGLIRQDRADDRRYEAGNCLRRDGCKGVSRGQSFRVLPRWELVQIQGPSRPNLQGRKQVRSGQLRLRELLYLSHPSKADLRDAPDFQRLQVRAPPREEDFRGRHAEGPERDQSAEL